MKAKKEVSKAPGSSGERIVEGNLSAKGYRFALVVSRFNDFISQRLVEGAIDCLNRHGENEVKYSVFKVPGAFDIPSLYDLGFTEEIALEIIDYTGWKQ